MLAFADSEAIAAGGDLDGIPIGFGFAVRHPGAYEIGGVHVVFDDPSETSRAPLLRALMEEADRRGWGMSVFHPTYDSEDPSVAALAGSGREYARFRPGQRSTRCWRCGSFASARYGTGTRLYRGGISRH